MTEIVVLCLIHFLYILKQCSIKHEYEGKWNEKSHLTTCDPHSKRTVVSSNTPQEVEAKKEIIFTYDVEYQVSSSTSNNL